MGGWRRGSAQSFTRAGPPRLAAAAGRGDRAPRGAPAARTWAGATRPASSAGRAGRGSAGGTPPGSRAPPARHAPAGTLWGAAGWTAAAVPRSVPALRSGKQGRGGTHGLAAVRRAWTKQGRSTQPAARKAAGLHKLANRTRPPSQVGVHLHDLKLHADEYQRRKQHARPQHSCREALWPASLYAPLNHPIGMVYESCCLCDIEKRPQLQPARQQQRLHFSINFCRNDSIAALAASVERSHQLLQEPAPAAPCLPCH